MLYFIKKEYHDKLQESDEEFLFDMKRAYFVVRDLVDKGEPIDLAIPVHANISEITQQEGWFLASNDTDHTKIGKVAGFNLAKAIPYLWSEFSEAAPSLSNELKLKDDLAKQNLPSLKQKAQKMLNDKNNGIMPTYGTDIDKDKEILKECVACSQKQQTHPKPKQAQSNSQQPQPQTQAQKQLDPTIVTKKEPAKVNTNSNSPPPTDKTSNFKDFSKANTHDEKLEQAKKLLKNNSNFAKLIQNIPKDKVQGDAQKVDKRGNKTDPTNDE